MRSYMEEIIIVAVYKAEINGCRDPLCRPHNTLYTQ
jgi:hypothetical protein